MSFQIYCFCFLGQILLPRLASVRVIQMLAELGNDYLLLSSFIKNENQSQEQNQHWLRETIDIVFFDFLPLVCISRNH